MTVSGNCSRPISASGRPLARAAVSARSRSAISASVSVTIHEVSPARSAPRQALGPVMGVVQISDIGTISLGPCNFDHCDRDPPGTGLATIEPRRKEEYDEALEHPLDARPRGRAGLVAGLRGQPRG